MAASTIKLASGHAMPLVGYGLWKVPKDKCSDTVYEVCSPKATPTTAQIDG